MHKRVWDFYLTLTYLPTNINKYQERSNNCNPYSCYLPTVSKFYLVTDEKRDIIKRVNSELDN